MKKAVFLVLMTFSLLAACAQSDFRLSPGVSVKSGVFHQTLEVGGTNGEHTWALVGDTYVDEATDNRQYYSGIKYLHQTAIGKTAFFVLGGEAKVHLDSDLGLIFEPQSGIQLNLGRNVGLLGTVSYPIREGDHLFNPVKLGSGVQLVFRL